MRLAFFGTPTFAVASLEALVTSDHEVVAVVTQPDRPRSRSHSTLLPPPVKVAAIAAGIPVHQPERPRGDLFMRQMRELDLDLGVVVAYGHILSPELLAIPRHGMVNVHASLLPRWRGAAPIQWAVASGDAETGVSIMRMEAGLDCGPVWHTVTTPIAADDTAGSLFDRLAELGARGLIEALPMIARGDEPRPQDASQVTLAPKLDRTTARIDWDLPAGAVSSWIRGMDPAPGAWSELGDEAIKVFGPTIVPGASGSPGTILESAGVLIACGEGAVAVAEVQPAGKRRMTAEDWRRGANAGAGTRFG
jgi:methionyl-tRNA formyltransferase